jgi:hypothetical protein
MAGRSYNRTQNFALVYFGIAPQNRDTPMKVRFSCCRPAAALAHCSE